MDHDQASDISATEPEAARMPKSLFELVAIASLLASFLFPLSIWGLGKLVQTPGPALTAAVTAAPTTTEEQATKASTTLAGHPMLISCNLADNGSVLGEAYVGGSSAWFTKAMCQDLTHFRSWSPAESQCVLSAQSTHVADCGARVDNSILAIQALAHESFHAQGVSDERLTDCYALQNVPYVAASFGATNDLALAVGHYLVDRYQAVRRPPAAYALPSGCVDGGSNDLRPQQAGWPE